MQFRGIVSCVLKSAIFLYDEQQYRFYVGSLKILVFCVQMKLTCSPTALNINLFGRL
jgi:hypothetical protein